MRILLTGASGGIGSALALAFARDGHTLLLQGRRMDRLEQLCASLPGDEHRSVAADLRSDSDRERLAAEAESFGIDTLCNNAGINQFSAFPDTDVAALIETNVTATLELTQRLLPQLLQREEPRVVFIGSAFGAIGFPGYSVYCASKFALRGFAEALAREYVDTALQIHYFAPRATDTAMNDPRVTAMNRALGTTVDTPESVARQVLEALKQARPRLQLGSAEAFQARLNALAPGLVDRALRGKLATIQKYLKETPHV
ncbi:MAG: SDR family oxidoreductase [Halieaceae bacterium]|jgi:short-subunit dehydrogenase|nr:SDR family oxidoreductase [Halieaceae bacterium]